MQAAALRFSHHVASPAILCALIRAARLVITRAIRVVDVCEDCGFDVDLADKPAPTDHCHQHGMVIAKQPLYGLPPGRDRSSELAQWCARQAIAGDAPAEVRAKARMVLDGAGDAATEQVAIRWCQAERREERL